MHLAGVGIWSGELRYGDPGAAAEAAAELDGLGFTSVWIPDVGGDVMDAVERLLRATSRMVVATGILNLWMHPGGEVAAAVARLEAEMPGRFLLGIGVSHAPLIDRRDPGRYRRPLEAMGRFLDELDAAPEPVPPHRRVLAALGPRMLELARTRSAGAHPYLVTPDHTAVARSALGAGALLVPEQAVVVTGDPETARAAARQHLAIYLGLPNYRGNLLRLGFDEADFAGGGSDRLVDGIVAWGDDEALAARVRAHFEAGADSVCVQVLRLTGAQPAPPPLEEWRRLAPVLTG